MGGSGGPVTAYLTDSVSTEAYQYNPSSITDYITVSDKPSPCPQLALVENRVAHIFAYHSLSSCYSCIRLNPYLVLHLTKTILVSNICIFTSNSFCLHQYYLKPLMPQGQMHEKYYTFCVILKDFELVNSHFFSFLLSAKFSFSNIPLFVLLL